METATADAVHDVAPDFDFVPWLAFSVIAFQSWRQHKKGAPVRAVMRRAFRRGSYSVASRGMAYLTMLLGCDPFVGAASSVLFRLGLSRYDAQKQFVEFVRCHRKTGPAALRANA